MFGLDARPRSCGCTLTVLDSDEVRAAKGYREARERAHADRERSLVEILRRGRDDGSFPLADPGTRRDRHQRGREPGDGRSRRQRRRQRTAAVAGRVLDFALRALGAEGATADRR